MLAVVQQAHISKQASKVKAHNVPGMIVQVSDIWDVPTCRGLGHVISFTSSSIPCQQDRNFRNESVGDVKSVACIKVAQVACWAGCDLKLLGTTSPWVFRTALSC